MTADQKVLYDLVDGSINEIHKTINYLVKAGFIKQITGSTKYKLTSPDGVNAYKQLKKEREQDTKNERQQRFDNKISIASLLIQLITFILGLLVEHYTGLVAYFIQLFS